MIFAIGATDTLNSRLMTRVAYFVSPHGFGHAARACAVMAELWRLRPELRFDIFTEVPRWFFSDSLPDCFSYHLLSSDVGMVQLSPLREDLDATIDQLDRAPLGDREVVGRLAGEIRARACTVVISDISPLGIAAAAQANIPSVLVENFTWDWIYGNIRDAPARLHEHGRRQAEIFASADLRIQTEPVCQTLMEHPRVAPVARSPRVARGEVRSELGVPDDDVMIVVSMGGVPWDSRDFLSFEHPEGAWIVVPGGSESTAKRRGRLVLLPFHAEMYHPDLVAASDVVISKLGYSTVAETYCGGAALAFVERPHFPESPVLARWVEANMIAARIEEGALGSGAWMANVNTILEAPRRKPDGPNGAVQAAEIIVERFGSMLSSGTGTGTGTE